MLLEHASPELLKDYTRENISPLMSAWMTGHLDNMNLLIDHGYDLWEK